MREVAKAREVLALMRAGAIDGLSIGFRTVRGRTDAKSGVRQSDRGRPLGDLGGDVPDAAGCKSLGGERQRRDALLETIRRGAPAMRAKLLSRLASVDG